MSSEPFCPYVGIRPFHSEENLLFFGRDGQTLEILQRLHENHFVAVVGGSGSGKSSLIRAGLIPALKGGYLVEDCNKWMIAVMKPGQNPMYSFAKAVLQQADPDISHEAILDFILQVKKEGVKAVVQLIEPFQKEHNINFFLLVDQFEELFRFTMEARDASRKTEAVDFVNLMLSLAKQTEVPFYIVLTMRSDFIGDCAQFHDLPEALNKSQYLVPRLNRQQLKMVIEGPAKLFGVRFSPALTSQLLNDLGNVKDELPLIQHALMRMWDYEMAVDKSGELDLEDYKAIGGYEKALSKHADEALNSLDEADQGIAKVLFQALTAIDENGRKIRRPLLLKDLKELTGASEKKLLAVIDHFIKDKRSFLVLENAAAKDEMLIDIAHESLIRQWETLNKWVDEEGESAEVYMKLVEDTWLYQSKRKDYLSGSELQRALEWKEKFNPTAVWANRYSNDSFEDCMHYLQESQEENIKLHRFSRAKRRRLRILYSVIIFIFLSLVGAVSSIYYMITLNDQLAVEKSKSDAYLLRADSRLQANDDPTLSLRLAEASLKIAENAGMSDTVTDPIKRTAQEIYQPNSFYKILKYDNSPVQAVAFSPADSTVLYASKDGTMSLLGLNGDLIHHFVFDEQTIVSMAFAPDGKSILCGFTDGGARLIQQDGTLKMQFNGHTKAVYSVAFSPDGKKILTGSGDSSARLWDVDTGTLVRELKGHTQTVTSTVFSPDGNTILTGSRDGTMRLYNLDGRLLQLFDKYYGEINAIAFAPDGKTILAGYSDYTARLWDLHGDLGQEFTGHAGAVASVIFSPDGRRIFTSSWDGTVRIWHLNGETLQVLKGHSAEVYSMSLTQGGKTLLTGSQDMTLRLWELKIGMHLIIRNSGAIKSVAFAKGDSSVLTGSNDSKVLLWSIATGHSLQEYKADSTRAIYSVVISPDGEKVLTASRDGKARLWDNNGHLLQTFKGHKDRIYAAIFSPDGNRVLTASNDSTTRLWNLKGEPLKVYRALSGPVYWVSFSPNGNTFFTCSEDQIGRLWDLESGEVIKEFDSFPISTAVFSPDGNTILTGSYAEKDNVARLWGLDGTLLRIFEGHEYNIAAVAFSHDGSKILTGSNDRTAILWDLEGNILQIFTGHTSSINSVAFSWDDSSVLTGSNDATIRMWAVGTPLSKFLENPDWGEHLSSYGPLNYLLIKNDSL